MSMVAHHAALALWRDAVAAATTDTVLLGDKGKGKLHYASVNSTYVPDLIKTGNRPEIAEFKNYSYAVRAHASAPGPTTMPKVANSLIRPLQDRWVYM